jgi:endonuclease/exonuclease/phosphatase family metal-dependent hydrolase
VFILFQLANQLSRRLLWQQIAANLGICAASLLLLAGCQRAAHVRATTWNLEWFPNGSAKEASPEEQTQRINAAANILRKLNPDILLLQEMRDYDACSRLAEAIQPGAYQIAICSAFKGGRQQEAILAKMPAQAAWTEVWKSMDGIDPPRGFAFAWFKVGNADIGVYSIHLKSNLIIRGDKETETARNIRKREVAAHQLVDHVRNVIEPKMPMIKGVVIGGDFNTNTDQAMFATEKTLQTLTEAGFENIFRSNELLNRITHPANHGYPDATFDYLFGRNVRLGPPNITRTPVSDHFPVTCDLIIKQ